MRHMLLRPSSLLLSSAPSSRWWRSLLSTLFLPVPFQNTCCLPFLASDCWYVCWCSELIKREQTKVQRKYCKRKMVSSFCCFLIIWLCQHMPSPQHLPFPLYHYKMSVQSGRIKQLTKGHSGYVWLRCFDCHISTPKLFLSSTVPVHLLQLHYHVEFGLMLTVQYLLQFYQKKDRRLFAAVSSGLIYLLPDIMEVSFSSLRLSFVSIPIRANFDE